MIIGKCEFCGKYYKVNSWERGTTNCCPSCSLKFTLALQECQQNHKNNFNNKGE